MRINGKSAQALGALALGSLINPRLLAGAAQAGPEERFRSYVRYGRELERLLATLPA